MISCDVSTKIWFFSFLTYTMAFADSYYTDNIEIELIYSNIMFAAKNLKMKWHSDYYFSKRWKTELQENLVLSVLEIELKL